MKKCPRCGGQSRHSHKYGFLRIRILRPLGIHLFRCLDCRTHFYGFEFRNRETTEILKKPQGGEHDLKQILTKMRAKEAELGLGKEDHSMTEELRQLHDKAEREGLAADHADKRG